jgi:hypothetical protein
VQGGLRDGDRGGFGGNGGKRENGLKRRREGMAMERSRLGSSRETERLQCMERGKAEKEERAREREGKATGRRTSGLGKGGPVETGEGRQCKWCACVDGASDAEPWTNGPKWEGRMDGGRVSGRPDERMSGDSSRLVWSCLVSTPFKLHIRGRAASERGEEE